MDSSTGGNRTVLLNMVSGLAMLIASTLVLFLVYRLANREIGIEQIGVWSILSAVSAFGSIGMLGMGGSLVKFAAEAHARDALIELPALINGLLWRMGLILTGFLLLVYVAANGLLPFFVDIKYLELTRSLLPLSLGIFWMNAMAQMFLSVVEGLNRVWQRNLVAIFGQVILLALTYWLVTRLGVKGLLLAQTGQMLLLGVGGFWLTRRHLPSYSVLARGADSGLVREAMQYGLKFQAQTVFQMLCDPVTKMFLSRYGGLSMVGSFELANRLVLQVRQVVLSVMNTLVPKLVHVHVAGDEPRRRRTFINLFAINSDLYLLILGGLFVFCSSLTTIWLGDGSPEVDFFIRLLSVAWLVNAFGIVPYLFNLSTGELGPNIFSHGLMAVVNLVIGFLVILLDLPPHWFVAGWALAVASSGFYLVRSYGRSKDLSLADLFTPTHLWIFFSVLSTGIVYVGVQHITGKSLWISFFGSFVFFLLLTAWVLRSSISFQVVREFALSFRHPRERGSGASGIDT